MNKIVKPDEQSSITLNKGKLRSTASPFQQRVNAAKASETDPATLPNRLCLMLDKSSSMSTIERGSERRIDLLKTALTNFVQRCNLSDTAIAIETFPEGFELALTNSSMVLSTVSLMLGEAGGNTPLRSCVERVLGKHPITRGVIVSDGEATDWHRYDDYPDEHCVTGQASDRVLAMYKEQGIPIDCVHIASDSGGEALLRRIAEATGGLFIKFTDVSAFAQAFGYLAPGFRAMLANGSVSASALGAREVVK
jgi:Mg-chelatase subunit ChlD